MKAYINAKVVFPDKIRDKCVLTDNGKIIDICDTADVSSETVDCGGLYLSPGFIDVHVHGGGSKSAMSTDPQDIVEMALAHRKFGTTSIVPTTLAAPVERLKEAVISIKKAASLKGGEGILGVHLEGPYISMKYKGAQSAENILDPTLAPPDELFTLWDRILMMGAAPECHGCLELGDKLTKNGIIASVAHSAARYEDIKEAVKHGYSDVTHIYSACSSCFKENLFRVAGVVEAGLVMDELTTQAIADLRHLPEGVLKLIYKAKGAQKMYVITDGLEFSAGAAEENRIYAQENGVGVIFEDGVMKLADHSALAGSVATLSDCVRNMKKIGVPLTDAVRMASLTPAEVLKVDDRIGKIEKGLDADLILFDEDINVREVFTKA